MFANIQTVCSGTITIDNIDIHYVMSAVFWTAA